MKICPKCQKAVLPVQKVEKDKKKKAWLIQKCPKCGFNFDLEEW